MARGAIVGAAIPTRWARHLGGERILDPGAGWVRRGGAVIRGHPAAGRRVAARGVRLGTDLELRDRAVPRDVAVLQHAGCAGDERGGAHRALAVRAVTAERAVSAAAHDET